MKKLVYSVLALGISFSTLAQDAAEKKVQAGLAIGSGLNFQKMQTKRLNANGMGNDLTIGANVIFNFSETIGFCTGAEFDFSTLKYAASGYEGLNTYYYYNDTEILQFKDDGVLASTLGNAKLFQMTERTQKATYLTIPTMLTFRTKFFGYFRYFGKFGLRNSFLLSSKTNDKGFNYTGNDFTAPDGFISENNNMKAKSEIFFFKSAVGLTGGAEWNFSGSTCLVAELGYYYGFTPLHSQRSTDVTDDNVKSYLFASGANNGNGDDVNFNNKATQSQLMLKISILF
jgi:hypothetical protein